MDLGTRTQYTSRSGAQERVPRHRVPTGRGLTVSITLLFCQSRVSKSKSSLCCPVAPINIQGVEQNDHRDTTIEYVYCNAAAVNFQSIHGTIRRDWWVLWPLIHDLHDDPPSVNFSCSSKAKIWERLACHQQLFLSRIRFYCPFKLLFKQPSPLRNTHWDTW